MWWYIFKRVIKGAWEDFKEWVRGQVKPLPPPPKPPPEPPQPEGN